MAEVKSEVVIRVRELVVGFDGTTVLDHMSLDVFRGEILGFVGGSGVSVNRRRRLKHNPPRYRSRSPADRDVRGVHTVLAESR